MVNRRTLRRQCALKETRQDRIQRLHSLGLHASGDLRPGLAGTGRCSSQTLSNLLSFRLRIRQGAKGTCKFQQWLALSSVSTGVCACKCLLTCSQAVVHSRTVCARDSNMYGRNVVCNDTYNM